MKYNRESHDNFLLEENKFYLIEMLSTISIVLSDNSRWHFWEPGDVSSIFIENHLSFRNTQNHFRKLSWEETDNFIHKKKQLKLQFKMIVEQISILVFLVVTVFW